MENHKQTVTMQMYCSCNDAPTENISSYRQGEFADLRPLYQKFAQTLELELQKLSQGYQAQMDALNGQIFSLKNTVQRLQIRNKKDMESEKQLRRQYNILLQKIKDFSVSNRASNQVRVVEKIKEVRVQKNQHDGLQHQLTLWKQKYQHANQLYLKTRGEKEAVDIQSNNLAEEVQRLKKIIHNLKQQLDAAKNREISKDQQVDKLQTQNEFLKTNKEVIIQTRHFFPDFKPSQKVRPQTKIQTIYVQKPVQKVVVLEVQRRVKEFIQPQRPLVNRIITCEPTHDCKCKQEESYGSLRTGQSEYLNEVVSRLESNIKEYKNQREKLVSVIDDKNRQLNSLETHLRLLGRSESYRGPSTVNVTVTKLEQPISQRVSRAEPQQNRVTQVRKR